MSVGVIGEEREHTITLINDFTISIEFDGGMDIGIVAGIMQINVESDYTMIKKN